LPAAAAGGWGGGATGSFRAITTGSVALLSVHASAFRRRHPVTRTISTRWLPSCAAATVPVAIAQAVTHPFIAILTFAAM
jgi:hypothetical protein